MRFVLTRATALAIEAHARTCLPREACGVLAVRTPGAGTFVGYRPVVNAADGTDRFSIDPIEFARAEKEIREAGHRLAGFFHSHPAGAARPSAADCMTAWPGVVHVILGLAGGHPAFAAFVRHGETLRRVPLAVES